MKLKAFLYLLMRDDVVCGRVAQLVNESNKAAENADFSNPHLARYAAELAERLQ